MLLADMLWSVAKAGLFEEVELGTLIEARITIVFIRMQNLHWLFVLCDTKFVELVDEFFLLRLFLLIGMRRLILMTWLIAR